MEALGKVSPCWSSGSSLESPNIETHQNGRGGGWRMDLNWEEHELRHFPVKQNDCYFFNFSFCCCFYSPLSTRATKALPALREATLPGQNTLLEHALPHGTLNSSSRTASLISGGFLYTTQAPLYHPKSVKWPHFKCGCHAREPSTRSEPPVCRGHRLSSSHGTLRQMTSEISRSFPFFF